LDEQMEGSKIEERPATLGARLRLRVPPDPQLGRYVREQILAFASALEIAETDLLDFLTALGEALANAIEHSGATEPIEVSVWLVGSDQLIATVVDRGIGFAPTESAVVEPHLPDAFAERGRGLPIMRTCSDIFSVRSAPGKGTAVTLGRHVRRASTDRRRLAAG
jgi:stage II sporulation protein AB (anti-sigma F factor)